MASGNNNALVTRLSVYPEQEGDTSGLAVVKAKTMRVCRVVGERGTTRAWEGPTRVQKGTAQTHTPTSNAQAVRVAADEG